MGIERCPLLEQDWHRVTIHLRGVTRKSTVVRHQRLKGYWTQTLTPLPSSVFAAHAGYSLALTLCLSLSLSLSLSSVSPVSPRPSPLSSVLERCRALVELFIHLEGCPAPVPRKQHMSMAWTLAKSRSGLCLRKEIPIWFLLALSSNSAGP